MSGEAAVLVNLFSLAAIALVSDFVYRAIDKRRRRREQQAG